MKASFSKFIFYWSHKAVWGSSTLTVNPAYEGMWIWAFTRYYSFLMLVILYVSAFECVCVCVCGCVCVCVCRFEFSVSIVELPRRTLDVAVKNGGGLLSKHKGLLGKVSGNERGRANAEGEREWRGGLGGLPDRTSQRSFPQRASMQGSVVSRI